MLTFDVETNYQAGVIPAFFRRFIQSLFFHSTTRHTIPVIIKSSGIFEALNRVQQFLQLPSYEADVHYMMQQNHKLQSIIRFKSATIKKESEVNKALEDVTISFTRGSLTVITGDEKKSLILHAAAGNCTIANGTVQLRDYSLSYCGKDIWVQSKSVKDNIVGDEKFDQSWYYQVVQACCLAQDIMSLPGNSNFVAVKGSSRLDLGQLQRLV